MIQNQYEQQLLDAGVDPNFISAERAKGKSGLLKGVNVDAQDYQPILDAFKALGGPYTVQNVNGVAVQPTPRPDFNDPLKMREFYLNELGVPAAITDVQNLTGQINKFDTMTQESLNAIENQPLRMGVITGEQAATARSAATTREAIARELLAKQSFLDSARTEANTRFEIANQERKILQNMIIESGGKAGISYTDSVEKAAIKLSNYQEKVAKEEAKAEEKAKLKDLAMAAGIKTKGKSRKELRRALEKKAKKDNDLKEKMDNLDLKIKEKELATKGSGSSTAGKYTTEDFVKTANDQKGEDGKMDPYEWNVLKAQWQLQGASGSTFDEIFAPYKNPERLTEYAVEPKNE